VLLKIANLYQKIVKNYLTFLPNSPAAKLGIGSDEKQPSGEKLALADRNTSYFFKKMSADIVKLIEEPDIKKTINFYIENHENILDGQGIYKMMFILQCIKETEHLEGDIIELGSYKGGNAIMMAKFLKQIGSKKKIYACDTFEGCPYDDEFVSNPAGKGALSDTSFDFVLKQIKKYGVNDKIILNKGLFSDTLDNLNLKKFSLVFIDCLVYPSAKFAINFAYPKLVDDGVLISSCYEVEKGTDVKSLWGETVAVDEYLSNKPEKIVIESMPFMQKGHNPPKIINKMPKNPFSTFSADASRVNKNK